MIFDRMRFFFGFLCATAALTIGCSGDDNKNSSNLPVSDVKGSIIDVHVTEMGDVPFTRGPAQFEIAAIVAGDGGTPQEILASIANDGTFVIPNVPEKPYDLRFIEYIDSAPLPPRYVVNAPRNIDLGRIYLGRPDATAITTDPTEIGLTTTGLDMWQDGDILEMFSLGSSAAGELVPTNGKPPTAGATSLTGYNVDTAQLASPMLVDGGKGDKAYITQLSGTIGTTAPYHSVRKVFEPASFTQMDGKKTSLMGAFSDVTQKNFTVDIDATAFNPLTTDVHPQAQIAGKNVHILAEPGGERTSTSTQPSLVICEALVNAKFPPSFSYGNPYPAAWSEIVFADVSYSLTHTAPTGVPKTTIVTAGQNGPAASFVTPAVPKLSPPLNLEINGMPAVDTLSGVGSSPTLTFSPPSIGTPAVYIIAVRRLDPGGAATRTTAIFSTTDTKLQIPAGLLDFGYYYYLRVTVRANFDGNHPFQSNTTNAYASALTGIITP